MEPNQASQFEQDELTGDKLLSGHDYDGIQELDNKLPKWWVWLFYITIVIAIIYGLRFHVLGWGDLQTLEYEKEVAEASVIYQKSAESNVINAENVTMLADEASLTAGKEIWDKQCVVCHLAQGQGLVGPNMTDEFWIHGCSINDIFNIIVVGVPAKGMISWKDQLTPLQIQQVSSFILTLVGTNPPNPKEPQGEKCDS